MKLGFMRDVPLTRARDTFLLDCRAARLRPRTLKSYRNILNSFIAVSGDMFVQELSPDNVRKYISDMLDRPGNIDTRLAMRHYAVIRLWVRWLYVQKLVTERVEDLMLPRWYWQRGSFYSVD